MEGKPFRLQLSTCRYIGRHETHLLSRNKPLCGPLTDPIVSAACRQQVG